MCAGIHSHVLWICTYKQCFLIITIIIGYFCGLDKYDIKAQRIFVYSTQKKSISASSCTPVCEHLLSNTGLNSQLFFCFIIVVGGHNFRYLKSTIKSLPSLTNLKWFCFHIEWEATGLSLDLLEGRWLQCWEKPLIVFPLSFLPEIAMKQTQLQSTTYNESICSVIMWMEMLLNCPSLPCLVSYLFQNNLWKPRLRYFSWGSTCSIFIPPKKVAQWVRDGRREVVGLS